MTVARSQQISLDHTPYYHCTSRCVRRAFLCGKDRYSGQNFEHRRQWLEDRLIELAGVFAIDLLAYAIMSNHYHVVVRLRPLDAEAWSDEEVAERWGRIYSVPEEGMSDARIAICRQRLGSLSWFMRCINEPLARRANREDDCSGCFWECRFRSQALLDEGAVLKCMAYVDLNPIRAGMAVTPEASAHTSIKARIEGKDAHLSPLDLINSTGKAFDQSIPMTRSDYLQLVDWTGRALSYGKRGCIPVRVQPLLDRLLLEPDHWVKEMRYYGRWYYRAVGPAHALQAYCDHLGQRWLKGTGRGQAILA